MSDGRLAVLGGQTVGGSLTSSCEALELDGDGEAAAHWVPLPFMRYPRSGFTCAAVAGSIIVSGGFNTKSAEVYDEVMGQWFRLPRDLPHNGGEPVWMGCALL